MKVCSYHKKSKIHLKQTLEVERRLEIIWIQLPPVIVDWDGLVGVRHHGDQHVEQDDYIATGVDAEHQQSPETGEFFYTCDDCKNSKFL